MSVGPEWRAWRSLHKLRKKMIDLGVSEGRLSMYGLEAIEEKSEDVRTFVRTHEFKY